MGWTKFEDTKEECSESHTIINEVLVFEASDVKTYEERGKWLPRTHQVSYCLDCAKIVGQEDNRERRRIALEFKGIQ